jgi:hypothetical protein
VPADLTPDPRRGELIEYRVAAVLLSPGPAQEFSCVHRSYPLASPFGAYLDPTCVILKSPAS